jgi:hypothetical protein
MSFFLVNHTQLKSGLTLEVSCVVSLVSTSGPVRIPLRSSLVNLYVTFSLTNYSLRKSNDSFEIPGISRICIAARSTTKTGRVSGSTLVSFTTCRRHYSGFPIAANSHCLTTDIGLRPRRRGSACSLLEQVFQHDFRIEPPAGLSLCTRLSQ